MPAPGHLPVNSIPQYFVPTTYAPDSLVNNEVGFKTLWFSRRLELNGAVYQEDWKNTQVQFFRVTQSGLGNLTFATNGPNYRVRGGEIQLIGRVLDGLTVQGSMSYNDGRQTNSPDLINNNPLSPTFGQPILSIPNPYGVVDTRLANSHRCCKLICGFATERSVGDYRGVLAGGRAACWNSISATGNVISYDQPGYTTYDAAIGVAKGNWNTQIFGQNLTSVNASTGTNAGQFVQTETVTRPPKVAGIKFGYRFSRCDATSVPPQCLKLLRRGCPATRSPARIAA